MRVDNSNTYGKNSSNSREKNNDKEKKDVDNNLRASDELLIKNNETAKLTPENNTNSSDNIDSCEELPHKKKYKVNEGEPDNLPTLKEPTQGGNNSGNTKSNLKNPESYNMESLPKEELNYVYNTNKSHSNCKAQTKDNERESDNLSRFDNPTQSENKPADKELSLMTSLSNRSLRKDDKIKNDENKYTSHNYRLGNTSIQECTESINSIHSINNIHSSDNRNSFGSEDKEQSKKNQYGLCPETNGVYDVNQENNQSPPQRAKNNEKDKKKKPNSGLSFKDTDHQSKIPLDLSIDTQCNDIAKSLIDIDNVPAKQLFFADKAGDIPLSLSVLNKDENQFDQGVSAIQRNKLIRICFTKNNNGYSLFASSFLPKGSQLSKLVENQDVLTPLFFRLGYNMFNHMITYIGPALTQEQCMDIIDEINDILSKGMISEQYANSLCFLLKKLLEEKVNISSVTIDRYPSYSDKKANYSFK